MVFIAAFVGAIIIIAGIMAFVAALSLLLGIAVHIIIDGLKACTAWLARHRSGVLS